MIIYVSPAELNGGILQFSTTITRETKAIKECKLFLPDVVDKRLFEDISDDVVCYRKVKTLRKNDRNIYKLATQILSYSPELVVCLEDSILMQQVIEILYQKKMKTAMVIHDIYHHPYRNMKMRKIIVDMIRRKMAKTTVKRCTHVILLSQNSEKIFKKRYHNDNAITFRLPAHVPAATSDIPREFVDIKKDFFLFFGRIDKYKGINRLCMAYALLPDDKKRSCKLVIAGQGQLSDEERDLIQAEPNIQLIERFVEDGEMIWLFEHAKAIILPYIEASQSGVLPIAYKFGKPVIVSNLEGLTENVWVNKTGCIFTSVDELKEILLGFDRYHFSADDIADYYQKNFLWENNLRNLFRHFQVE